MKEPVMKEPKVVVVRDSRDARRDYYIPASRALELFKEGKLQIIQVYSQGVQYLALGGRVVR